MLNDSAAGGFSELGLLPGMLFLYFSKNGRRALEMGEVRDRSLACCGSCTDVGAGSVIEGLVGSAGVGVDMNGPDGDGVRCIFVDGGAEKSDCGRGEVGPGECDEYPDPAESGGVSVARLEVGGQLDRGVDKQNVS